MFTGGLEMSPRLINPIRIHGFIWVKKNNWICHTMNKKMPMTM